MRRLGVCHQLVPRLRSRADDVVQHAGRQPGIGEASDELRCRQGGLAGRLGHHRAAGCQGRTDLPAQQVDGIVPGHDGDHHPHRLAQDEAANGGRARRAPFTADGRRQVGVVVHHVAGEADLLEGVRQRLALFPGQGSTDVVQPLAHQGCGAAQDGGAFDGWRGRPTGKGICGGGEGSTRVVRRAARRRADQLAIAGVSNVRGCGAGGGLPSAADQQVGVERFAHVRFARPLAATARHSRRCCGRGRRSRAAGSGSPPRAAGCLPRP